MGEKKEIRVRLSTVVYLFVILVLVVALGIVYYCGFVKDDNAKNVIANGEVAEKNNISVNEEKNNAEENQIEKSPYEKYNGLLWFFDEGKYNQYSESLKEIEWDYKKITIKDGVAYFKANGTEKKIEAIRGRAKYVIGWGVQTLTRVYILTEEGTIWKSIVDFKGDGTLNSDFERINIEGKVINMTNGNPDIRIVEPPYFLLETGELVNEQGIEIKNQNTENNNHDEGKEVIKDWSTIDTTKIVNAGELYTYSSNPTTAYKYQISNDKRTVTGEKDIEIYLQKDVKEACLFYLGQGSLDFYTFLYEDGTVAYATDNDDNIKEFKSLTNIIKLLPLNYRRKVEWDNEKIIDFSEGTIIAIDETGNIYDLGLMRNK